MGLQPTGAETREPLRRVAMPEAAFSCKPVYQTQISLDGIAELRCQDLGARQCSVNCEDEPAKQTPRCQHMPSIQSAVDTRADVRKPSVNHRRVKLYTP